MMNWRLMAGFGLGLVLAGPVLAGHANPWAGGEDAVLEQYHEVNQARSEGTLGEDEMRGVMVQKAIGKLGGGTGGQEGGQGGGNGGGSGHGRGR